ncbi:MAG: BatA domain-containing protein [Crocinitomicaceae bacterium]|nr:BatA domain-containing protein [Crocinitomicaceae bacterium]
MKFVHPEFLWALFLLAVPVIIHLFSFRRYRTVYFSRVDLLREVTEDSRTGVKLKHILVLISRLLAMIFLILAFAQPFIPGSDQQESTENISLIYLDNSYSMQADGKDGNLLNECKNRAIELVKSFDADEKIALFSSDLLSSEFRYYTSNDIIDKIKKIDFTPKATALSTVLNAMCDMSTGEYSHANYRVFLFTDFQKSTTKLDEFRRDEIPTYYYQPAAQIKENIFIDSVWFETPVHRLNAPIDIWFRIQNQSDVAQTDLSVTLDITGSQPAPKRVSVEARSSEISSINFTDREPGIKSGKLSVETGQLYFDDSFFFSYEIKDEVKILLVTNSSNDNRNLQQLYQLDPYYNCTVTEIKSATQDDFKGKELIIIQNAAEIPGGFHDLIKQALKDGATVAMIPSKNTNTTNWNIFLNELHLPGLGNLTSKAGELSYFNYEDPLYKGVFESKPENYKFPQVSSYYPLQVSGSQNFITLFGFNPTMPYMIMSQHANGRIILTAGPVDMEYNNFQNHALFAATYLRIAETSSFQRPLYMTIGSMENLPQRNEIDEKEPVHLVNTDEGVDFIPQLINTGNSRMLSFSQMEDQLRQSGFYQLKAYDKTQDILALNYNRNESYTEALSSDDVKKAFLNAGWTQSTPLTANDSGNLEVNQLKANEFWRWSLILSLLFIAVEILLLKFWKS